MGKAIRVSFLNCTHASENLLSGSETRTLINLRPRGARVPFLLSVFCQQRVLVVVPHIRFRDGDRQDAAEVGQLLLVEALDQARQIGDTLQLDHVLENTNEPLPK